MVKLACPSLTDHSSLPSVSTKGGAPSPEMVVLKVIPRPLVVKEAIEGFVDSGGDRCIDVRLLVIAGRVSSSNTSATEGDCNGDATSELGTVNGNSVQTGGSNGVLALAPTSSSSSAAVLLAFSIDIAPRLCPLKRDLSWELLADERASWEMEVI